MLEYYTKKNCKQEEFRVEKLIKTKGDRHYVKQKRYDNSFIVT